MSMLPQLVIRKKRNGEALSEAEINAFVTGITNESITEGQAAAFAMAVFFQGMSRAECAIFTRAMTASGETMEWSGLDRPVLDKHSTGGVGDNVSLMLAPIVAAAGAAVPMISGRGLGHTGGTLDKLEAIPGYDAMPDTQRFREVVGETGCAIIGQTGNLAPADRRLYAIRDVTATVESVPLITASILSKKLAAGLDGLVMDIKTGNGAFAATMEFARDLGRSIVGVAAEAGLPATALITDMNQPLASAAGNAVEVQNAVDYLTGKKREERLHRVVTALCAQMLVTGKLAANAKAARQTIEDVLASGAAAERFQRMTAALGGPADFVEQAARYLPVAPVVEPVYAEREGHVTAIDTFAIGNIVVALGGGRRRPSDRVDPAVGLTALAAFGDPVEPGQPLAMVHARTGEAAAEAVLAVRQSYRLGAAESVDQPELIRERIGEVR